MAGSYLDTTIVVHLSDTASSTTAQCQKLVVDHPPSETPYYALRELLAGHLHNLCYVHNALLASNNPIEALAALLRLPKIQGRKRDSKIHELVALLQKVFDTNPTGERSTVKEEALADLALRIARIWSNSHKLKNVELTQPLSCFNAGKIQHDDNQALQGPGRSFNCLKSQRCSAAVYIYDDISNLEKVIAALHPNALDDQAAQKRENQTRRKALKELYKKGPKDFDKGLCRALGDAYFAILSPPGLSIATTNKSDFEPICEVLHKKIISP